MSAVITDTGRPTPADPIPGVTKDRSIPSSEARNMPPELGTDAVASKPTAEEAAFLDATLERYLSPAERKSKPAGLDFQKVVAGRKLWNFDKREWKIWQEAL